MEARNTGSWARLRQEFDHTLSIYRDALDQVSAAVRHLTPNPSPEQMDELLRARISERDARDRYSAAAKAFFGVALGGAAQ